MSTNSILSKMRQEIERRFKKAEYETAKAIGVSHDGYIIHQAESNLCLFLLDFLDTLSEEPDRPEPYTGKYDEAYLNEKIKRASEHWKGVDVDKMLAECRGYDEEPDKSLEEAARKYTNDSLNNLGAILRVNVSNAFKAGAEWMAGQGVTCGGLIMRGITGETYAESDYVPLDGKCGDRVIVQIRKKN